MNERVRGDVVIRTPDQRLRVFVGSTLGELAEERRAVARAISALRLTPVLFEAGARPHPPRQLYRAYLAQSDVFVGLYWQRYGQISPGMEISGLEEEFQLSQETLGLSLAAHDTRTATLYLAGFAQLAFVQGDPERAALLVGAAEGPTPAGRPGGCGRCCGEGGRAGGPGPPDAGGGPLRPGVRRRRPAQPPGRGGHRAGRAWRRHPGVLSRGRGQHATRKLPDHVGPDVSRRHVRIGCE
jgi:hypothetical protein